MFGYEKVEGLLIAEVGTIENNKINNIHYIIGKYSTDLLLGNEHISDIFTKQNYEIVKEYCYTIPTQCIKYFPLESIITNEKIQSGLISRKDLYLLLLNIDNIMNNNQYEAVNNLVIAQVGTIEKNGIEDVHYIVGEYFIKILKDNNYEYYIHDIFTKEDYKIPGRFCILGKQCIKYIPLETIIDDYDKSKGMLISKKILFDLYNKINNELDENLENANEINIKKLTNNVIKFEK